MEQKGHIIWIDDEIHHLKPHILFLEAKGYKITTATNGSDANILNQEKTIHYLESRKPKRIIIVPQKIINIVI